MRFHSLPVQVAEHLNAEIASGRWVEYLPGERTLAATLRVSRRTLTAALAQLQRTGVIKSEPARGHRIVQGATGKPASVARLIGLLTPEPLDSMRPGTTLWVNDLQALLGEANFRLNLFHGQKYVAQQPGRALAKLVAGNPHAGWLLAGTPEPTQRWFAREKVPAIIAGTRHAGIALPDVDLDFFALGRHVAGRLAAHRHRQAALLLSHAPGYFMSEADTERGFRDVFEKAGGQAVILYHERTREGLARALRRLFTTREHVTALVVVNSLDYLTATSFLAQRGLRVPQDVAVIARNDDAFMSALLPEPTRYHASPHVIARRIFKLLMQVAAGETPPTAHVRIMPAFIAGESLSTAPASALTGQA
jgi:DNA-binding LacI/PurR family transcriptional regulator